MPPTKGFMKPTKNNNCFNITQVRQTSIYFKIPGFRQSATANVVED